MERDIHKALMQQCLSLAKKGRGAVSPNPLVGAILVKGGRIVARGYHRRFGGPHAEVECLRSYRGDASSATLYVNLEPCSHFGKTPPCTDLILRSGIRRVIVAMRDPNPLVSGRGIRRLRSAGVEVLMGVLEEEAAVLNRFFVKHITTGMPYVHLKLAQSLDGKIADSGGNSRWISSPESRSLVHQWRAEYDAILVGAGTVEKDNPALTVRMVRGRNPDVVVLDGRFRVPSWSRIFSVNRSRRIFLCIGRNAARRQTRRTAALRKRGIEVIEFQSERGHLSLKKVLRVLYSRGIGSLLVEGGGMVFSDFIRNGLADELSVFVAPRIIGEGVDGFVMDQRGKRPRLFRLSASPIGPDILLKGATK